MRGWKIPIFEYLINENYYGERFVVLEGEEGVKSHRKDRKEERECEGEGGKVIRYQIIDELEKI